MPDHAPAPGTVDPLGLHGVVPPTVTAFHTDESLDAETTAAHARYVVDSGAHGVFPLETNGEFPSSPAVIATPSSRWSSTRSAATSRSSRATRTPARTARGSGRPSTPPM